MKLILSALSSCSLVEVPQLACTTLARSFAFLNRCSSTRHTKKIVNTNEIPPAIVYGNQYTFAYKIGASNATTILISLCTNNAPGPYNNKIEWNKRCDATAIITNNNGIRLEYKRSKTQHYNHCTGKHTNGNIITFTSDRSWLSNW